MTSSKNANYNCKNSKKNCDTWTELEKEKLKNALIPIYELEDDLRRQYEKALDEIVKEVTFFISKYSSKNNLTYTEAKKLLNSKEMKRFKLDLENYIKLVEDDELLSRLRMLNEKSSITHLEELFYNCDKCIDDMTETSLNSLQIFFTDTLDNSYRESMYNLHKFIGFATAFTLLNSELIKDILSYQWSGLNYSQRVKINSQNLKNMIREEIIKTIIRNRGISISTDNTLLGDKILGNNLRKKFVNHYKNYIRLIHTEHAYFMNKASQLAYEEAGINKYEYLAIIDSRTSDICRDLNGKVFDFSEAVVGVNYPPMHVYCRSAVAPYIDNRVGDKFTKKTKIYTDTTYKEWEKIVKIN